MSHLVALALEAQTNEDAIPVLGDALQEAGWDDVRVMMLVFGTELDPLPPKFYTAVQNAAWHKQREDAIARPQAAAPLYAGRRKDWARAVLAVLLFADWPARRKRTVTEYRTRSPWRLAVEQYRQREKDNKAMVARYTELDRRAAMAAS